MKKLEKYIYDSIKDRLHEKLEIVRSFGNLESKYIEIPFECDGVIDTLIYDVSEDKFTKIRYSKGKGDGLQVGNFHNYSAYFDDVEYLEFEI